jgi:hypothetical protein
LKMNDSSGRIGKLDRFLELQLPHESNTSRALSIYVAHQWQDSHRMKTDCSFLYSFSYNKGSKYGYKL